MVEWWESLTSDLQVFYTIGIASTFVLIIQAILMMIGGDVDSADVDVGDVPDMNGTLEHPGDLHLLSVRTVVAFFVGFGWTGVICLKRGISIEMTILFSFLVGSFFMFVVFYLMRFLYGLRESGNINYENAVGKIGSVYIPIPPDQSAPGEVEIMIQGRVRFVQAFNRSPQRLKSNTRVKVVELIDSRTLLVEPLATNSNKEES